MRKPKIIILKDATTGEMYVIKNTTGKTNFSGMTFYIVDESDLTENPRITSGVENLCVLCNTVKLAKAS